MAIPAFIISLLAFAFVVISFWWMHWRTGNLQLAPPRTYQGYANQEGNMTLAIPMLFFNDGPTPILVNNLRLRFLHEAEAGPLVFQATFEHLSYDEDTRNRAFATPFPVRGREALLKICEFKREPAGWEFAPQEHRLALDAKIGIPPEWKQIGSFPLAVTEESAQTLKKQFLVHDNPVST